MSTVAPVKRECSAANARRWLSRDARAEVSAPLCPLRTARTKDHAHAVDGRDGDGLLEQDVVPGLEGGHRGCHMQAVHRAADQCGGKLSGSDQTPPARVAPLRRQAVSRGEARPPRRVGLGHGNKAQVLGVCLREGAVRESTTHAGADQDRFDGRGLSTHCCPWTMAATN